MNRHHDRDDAAPDDDDGLLELACIGDLNDAEADLTEKLLGVPPGGECLLFFDSPGGSPYTALSLMSLILMRGLNVTAVVTGECSSAALWPFSACRQRIVTQFSVLLFHPMKWQSEEHVGLAEAAEWARHFAELEADMDLLLARQLGLDPDVLRQWSYPGRYVSGRQLSEAGVAQLVDLAELACYRRAREAARATRGKSPRRR